MIEDKNTLHLWTFVNSAFPALKIRIFHAPNSEHILLDEDSLWHLNPPKKNPFAKRISIPRNVFQIIQYPVAVDGQHTRVLMIIMAQ